MQIIKKGFLEETELEKVEDEGGRKYFIREIGPVDSVTTVLERGYPKAYTLIQWFIKNTKEYIESHRKRATDNGTACHSIIERLVEANFNGSVLSTEELERVRGIVAWAKEYRPKVIATEKPICFITDTIKTAGRIDLLCEIGGVRTVVDFKTGKDLYPTYSAQLAIYAKSLDAKEAGCVLITDTKIGYRYKKYDIEKGFKAFEAAFFLAYYKPTEVA